MTVIQHALFNNISKSMTMYYIYLTDTTIERMFIISHSYFMYRLLAMILVIVFNGKTGNIILS